MTTLPPSNSNNDSQVSSGFYQLHEKVQRWIWQKGWGQLREVQELAIAPILNGHQDVIISAATAGGKTEAAFLPILSRIMEDPGKGIRVLYISPLKALINDQYRRLSELGDMLDIPIHPWHGDIDAGRKQKVLKNPSGIVLITPESLEALFVRRGPELVTTFQSLNYIVVDELHSFVGAERGRQLQSLMHRVELVVRRSIPRIGLSATLGDMSLAADFLRTGKANVVTIINPPGDDGRELKIQVRGYRRVMPTLKTDETDGAADPEEESKDELDIAAHLFKVLRGTDNLIFINRRSEVEAYADRLRRLCEQNYLPNEFLPHHGSLSKELREEAEEALRSDRPASVVCTTTLEMGIDIGSVHSIAQVGAPFSVASTRQRLGRSGRREGDPAIMRFYITEPEVTPETSPEDAIHSDLVQTIAIINLLLDRWCEPPITGKLHLSTLIQQFLSLIAQHGGVKANQAWQVLCETGPFRTVDQGMFIQLLRCLGQHDLIQQSQDGLLLLGLTGEKLVNHYSFYTAFQTPEEYRIVTSGRTLGTLPIDSPLVEGMYLIFAGRRWLVLSVDQEHKVVDVAKAAAGRVPKFGGDGGMIHNRVRQEMYRIYCSQDVPIFLDAIARDLLLEARANFTRYGLGKSSILAYGSQTLLFYWMGDIVLNTIMMQLIASGVRAWRDGVAIVVDKISSKELSLQLQKIIDVGALDALSLASNIGNKVGEKYDSFLSEELLSHQYAACHLNVNAAHEVLLLHSKSGIYSN
ncbi:DEAD/DEAH box helicase [Leptolyngbya sp. AN02str]|uniref:DEAD/DEAH box helicase n=1 Tax=Leptolyngbya sp. AN02str TaxID=3423363 RepID=UPI003D316357